LNHVLARRNATGFDIGHACSDLLLELLLTQDLLLSIIWTLDEWDKWLQISPPDCNL
jgi:hypothetical protein